MESATKKPAVIEILLKEDILFTRPNPATIGYAKYLESARKNAIEYLSVPAFEEIIRKNPERKNFCWSENLMIDKALLNTKVTSEENYIDGKYNGTIAGLIIVNMGQLLGHGVITLNPISKGTIVSHYAGIILAPSTQQLDNENFISSYKMNYDEYSIDAKESGNISAFVQDAPTEKELKKDYVLNDDLVKQVVTANISFEVAILQGQKIAYLQAVRDIQAGEMLLASYGDNYWYFRYLISKTQRFLLTKAANIIPVGQYQYIGGKIHLKYDNNNYVELPCAAFVKAYQAQQPLRYEFTSAKGQKEIRFLAIDNLRLILLPTLWTTVIDPARLPLKYELIERIHKEHQLQKLLWPLQTKYNRIFYSKGMALLKDNQAFINIDQAIAYLLQALLLGIKENISNAAIASIYFDLGNAYAAKAQKEQNIAYIQVAIYLLKQSIKLVSTFEKNKQLRAYKRWQRKQANLLSYWSDYCLSFFGYLQRL